MAAILQTIFQTNFFLSENRKDHGSVKNYEKYLEVRSTSYFLALRLFRMFIGPLFQMKLRILSAVLLSEFQSSPGAEL